VLLFLVLSPLFGHHVLAGADRLLAGRDHIGAICVIALHALLGPVHRLFHLLFIGGVVYAISDRFHAWRTERNVLGSLAAEPPQPGDPFWMAARSVGVDPLLLRTTEGLPTPAFTVGWWRPRVYVARALGNLLQPEELAAVVAHEAAHVRRRDPLRLSLLRFLTCTLFWIPALRRLADDVADEAEIQADDAAAAGRPLALASAILSLARWLEGRRPARGLRAAVGFHRDDLLDRRVRRLLGENTTPESHLTRRSLAGAAAALLLVVLSGAVVAHPLPGEHPAHPEHCESHPGTAASHLFCNLRAGGPLGLHCPHLRPLSSRGPLGPSLRTFSAGMLYAR
jgi:Zn-dependent protease with chaperone function